MRLGTRGRFAAGIAVALRPGDADAGAAASAAQAGAALYAFPPHLYPPEGSRPIMAADQQNVAGAGVTLALPGTLIQLDRGYVGVIDQLVIFADNPDLATRARWAIRVNGVAAPGLSNITDIFALASSQRLSFDKLGLVVAPGRKIDVAVTNLDGVGRVYGAQLVGWSYRATGGVTTNA